jgi:exodeoxyribonuclease V gamma subunit
MPLFLHSALSLPALADSAATILRAPPPGDDPFATDVLVVGGRGVEQWVRLALAERLDIVANLELWSPSRFVQDLERWATGEVPASAATLTLDLLAAVQRDPSLLPPELRHLRETAELGGTAGAGGDLVSTAGTADANTAPPVVHGLLAGWAGRMARTFERYQLHRHDWLLAWERGDAPDDWQARLWRATIAASSRTIAPATAHEVTRRALLSARATTGLAPRWLLVHQGRLAPAHLALVRALATHREVHLLVHAATHPTRAHAAHESVPDASALHPVAARLDRARIDAVRLVRRELGDVAQFASAANPAARRDTSSLLAAVQHAVQQYATHDAPLAVSPADHSLRVLACHGALRQVEVLKDALLGALNADPTLQPRDLLVLTPDPARFVPLLQAVLPLSSDREPTSAARDSGTPPLLLHVQGRSPRATNPVADVLLQLLALVNERVSASRVLTLVERGPVAERFGIAPTDAPLVREWFQTAGVRWGTDADDPARAGLGLHDEGTWARGLVRVLLGTALLDEGERADTHLHGHAPVPGLEGERVLLVGRAARAIRLMLALLDDARAARPLRAWAEFVDHALQLLVDPNGVYSASVTRVRDVVQALGGTSTEAHGVTPASDATTDAATNAASAGPDYSASALAALLEHRLEDVLGAPGRLGGITVAPLTAGWVRPARVIALLGMDDELFPRRGGAPWFDRLAESPRVGDLDDRGEQLQTVFDALCMAQDRLLITYTGWNRAGTMRLPPSVAVSALADAVHHVVAHAPDSTPTDSWRAHVEYDVPLQPFSRRAFATDSLVPSFDALAAGTSTRLRRRDQQQLSPRRSRAATSASATRRDVLPLATLLRFLARPADEILARLGVRLGMDAPLVDDVLALDMPRFDEAVAVTEMAHALLLGQPLHERFEALRHRDRMPPAVLGRAWQHHASQRARHLADRARHAVDDQPRHDRVVLRVPVGETTLTGTIDTRHGHQLLFLRDGRHAMHRVLAPFVTLCFATLGDPTITQAIQLDADETVALAPPPNPMALLADLIALYHDADRAVPAYAPQTSFAYVAELSKSAPAEQKDPAVRARALEKARSVWTSDDPAKPGESDEPANQLLHLVPPVDEPAFATTAQTVFMPMLHATVGP